MNSSENRAIIIIDFRNQLTVGRELRVVELKKKIKELEEELKEKE